MNKKTVTDELVAEVLPLLRNAVMHQIRYWDALREIEAAIGNEIDASSLENYAISSGLPADAYAIITPEECQAWLSEYMR